MGKESEALNEGIRWVMHGLQMILHALEGARWTLLALKFDFYGTGQAPISA